MTVSPVTNRLTDQAATVRRWLSLHGPRAVASIAFLGVHVAGGVYALNALQDVWQFRLLLQLLAGRVPILGALPGVWYLIPVGLCFVIVLAMIEIGRILTRLWRGQPEIDIALRARTLLYAAMGCLLVAAFYLSTPEAFSGPFRVRHPITSPILAAFTCGAYALWSLRLPRLRRKTPSRFWRTLDMFSMNAVVALILGEGALRVLAAFGASPLLVTERSPSPIRRDSERQAPGEKRFGFPMNMGGHYDAEFVPRSATQDKVVVSIGDSFSYGSVPHAYHFTTVAERALPGVQFYNMGYPGTGPGEYRYLLEHDAIALQPDLAVVQLFVGNDVTAGWSVAGPPRWYDADNYLVAVVWYRLQIMRRAKRESITEVAKRSKETSSDLAVRYPWLADPLREQAPIARDVFLQLELRNALEICVQNVGAYPRFFEMLAAIEQSAGDVPLAFAVIPDEFQVDDDLWKEIAGMTKQPLDRDRPQRVVGEWLRGRRHAVLDLLPILRAVEPMKDGRRHLYHLQDTHFNARGNEVAGRALARFSDSLLSVPAERRGRGGLQRVSAPPPLVSLPLRLNLSDSTTRQWMSGWHAAEPSGGRTLAWSQGQRSILRLSLPTGADIRMDFEALPFEFRRSPTQHVTITVNGTEIEKVQLRSGLQRYSVILPAAALRQSPHTLVFNYTFSRKPTDVVRGSPDVRELAVAWYSIDFTPRNP